MSVHAGGERPPYDQVLVDIADYVCSYTIESELAYTTARNCLIDTDDWQGFAFGFGVDRLARLKYGMPDLRDMFASDVRWLAHYGFSAFAAPNPASGLS